MKRKIVNGVIKTDRMSIHTMALRDPVHGWIKYTDAEEKVLRTPLGKL